MKVQNLTTKFVKPLYDKYKFGKKFKFCFVLLVTKGLEMKKVKT